MVEMTAPMTEPEIKSRRSSLKSTSCRSCLAFVFKAFVSEVVEDEYDEEEVFEDLEDGR